MTGLFLKLTKSTERSLHGNPYDGHTLSFRSGQIACPELRRRVCPRGLLF
ncbi:MAG TPA: hypothetical protein DDW84_02685 [Phycisphaerales bacterium]|nr:hypothetical protein [Phycisphaerales bacterium]HBR20396.1 hypothetical protein [Phycisphaerales bacterium]